MLTKTFWREFIFFSKHLYILSIIAYLGQERKNMLWMRYVNNLPAFSKTLISFFQIICQTTQSFQENFSNITTMFVALVIYHLFMSKRIECLNGISQVLAKRKLLLANSQWRLRLVTCSTIIINWLFSFKLNNLLMDISNYYLRL